MGFLTPAKAWRSDVSDQILDYVTSYNYDNVFDKAKVIDLTRRSLNEPSELSGW